MQSQQTQQINPDAPVKEYTGVWIPADVMESEELSPMEKLLYGEIAGFRTCYASNAWFANRLGRCERSIRRMISHLIELGFVEDCGFNGRFRLIRVGQKCPVREDKNVRPARTKMSSIDKSIEQSIYIDKSIDGNEPSEKKQYGNKDVNELFKYWEGKTGIKPSSNKTNRNACYTLIRQRGGLDGAKHVVDNIHKALISQDRFAPRISSFSELYGAYGKLSKLDAWIIKNSPKTALKRYQTAQTANYEPSDTERAETLEKMKEARKKLFNS